MSNNRIQWNGLAELRAALRRLPEELTGEAAHIIEGAANAAAADIRAAYPTRSGDLRDHVFVSHQDHGKFSAGAIVKNTAKHAWLFDEGSQARHTDIGANRGTMPATHLFVKTMIAARRRMYGQLKDLLTRKGLQVSGDV